MKRLQSAFPCLIVMLATLLPGAVLADFELLLPMSESATGNYAVTGRFGNGTEAEFLVDTGAGITTISTRLFSRLQQARDLRPVRRVAARLANGKLEVVKIYVIEDFKLADRCELGAIEVAVMSNDGRNILGMSTLAKTAPFGLHLAPPVLAVSHCAGIIADGAELALRH